MTGVLMEQTLSEPLQWDTKDGRVMLNLLRKHQSTNTTISPYDEAALVYQREPCARSFEEDLDLHLRFGYVFSTPHAFIMGRAVSRAGDPSDIVNPAFQFDAPDTWWIYLAAGDLREFFLREPYPLPWVGWEIRNKPRFYSMDRVKERILCIR